MLQFESTKRCFQFSLGFCSLFCLAVYVTTRLLSTDTAPHTSVNCRPFPQSCAPFLRGKPGAEWQKWDCLSGGYLTEERLNCSRVEKELHFITRTLSQEEEEYPLAFIITIHKDVVMFARLLRAVYAPQNVYCVHVDDKSPRQYKDVVRRLARCFPNVLLASQSEKVTYAGFSRLKADINCMGDLVRSPVPWRKVVNLCGQDFPVKSNLELVRYLQSSPWRERNMTPGVKQPAHMRYRTQKQYREVVGSHVEAKGWGHSKEAPPHNLQLYFGTAYYALTRPFVDFVLKSQVAKDLLEWSKDTYSPDEHYWVTLNHLKDAPGSNPDGGWEGDIRALKWKDQVGVSHSGCNGKYVRGICIYGLDDLPWIMEKNSMFANKFETKTFPTALDCLELWHRQKVLRQAKVPVLPAWRLATETNSTQHWAVSLGP